MRTRVETRVKLSGIKTIMGTRYPYVHIKACRSFLCNVYTGNFIATLWYEHLLFEDYLRQSVWLPIRYLPRPSSTLFFQIFGFSDTKEVGYRNVRL